MPTASQHRGKAEKNLAFLATIATADHPEWAATVAFYAALRRVEQLRADAGDGHSQNHADRLRYVSGRLAAVRDPFRKLYDAALVARYEPAAVFFRQFTPQDVQAVLIDTHLAAVEAFATPPPAEP